MSRSRHFRYPSSTPRNLGLILTVGIATFGLASCASAEDAEPETTSFTVVGDELTITKKSDGAIDLRTGDIDEVEVTRWFTGDPDEAIWDLADNELTLATDCGFLSSCDIRYEVTVPLDLAVNLDSSNGDVGAADFETALSIQTENGAITVEDVSGDLSLHSTSGDHKATGVSSSDVVAQSENGEIDLHFTTAPLNLVVATDNGNASVRVPDETYAVSIFTDSGSVHNALTESDDSPRKIGVTTENGDIDLSVD